MSLGLGDRVGFDHLAPHEHGFSPSGFSACLRSPYRLGARLMAAGALPFGALRCIRGADVSRVRSDHHRPANTAPLKATTPRVVHTLSVYFAAVTRSGKPERSYKLQESLNKRAQLDVRLFSDSCSL